jgi:hypothetical protein
MEIATFQPKAAGRFFSRLLDSRWLKLLKAVGQPLGNAQRLLESLWAILKGYRKAAGKCPNTRCQLIGE